jgi:hypothetical protein
VARLDNPNDGRTEQQTDTLADPGAEVSP